MLMRKVMFRIIGAIAVLAAFFFGTLYAMDFVDRRTRDGRRVETAKAVMAALAKFRAAKTSYPILPNRDGYITDLAPFLVTGGFIGEIPPNPPGAEPTRYYSDDGKSYGLWLHFERSENCKIEVDAKNTGWWGNPAICSL